MSKLLDKIHNRTTFGGEFAKIEIELNKNKTEISYDNFDFKSLEMYYEDTLKAHFKVIEEKIKNETAMEESNKKSLKDIENIIHKSKKQGRFQGIVITIILELIIGFALYIFGLA